jgi:type I restriction enzyme S subunit
MSKLDKLIAELCPDGVEYVKLCDICKISNGKDHKDLVERENVLRKEIAAIVKEIEGAK